jgi:hypothetical protein
MAPQVIGPFELDVLAKRLSQAEPDSQRKTGPIAGVVGQADGKSECMPRLANPSAPLTSAPCRLALCKQQNRILAALSGAPHQLAVGRVNLGQDLDAESWPLRHHGLPDGFRGPALMGSPRVQGHLNSVQSRQAAFFFTIFSSFLSFLIFFSIFLIWLGILGVAGLRLGASKVLRQLTLPHQQGYSAFSLGV